MMDDYSRLTSKQRLIIIIQYLSEKETRENRQLAKFLQRAHQLRESPDVAQEVAFMKELYQAIIDHDKMVGMPLLQLHHALKEAREDDATPSPQKAPDIFYTLHLGKAKRLMEHAEECQTLAYGSYQVPPRARIRLAMESICHMAALLDDAIYAGMTPQKKPSETKADFVSRSTRFVHPRHPALKRFVNLAWMIPEVFPIGLQDLRNAWVHGDAELNKNDIAVHLQDSKVLLLSPESLRAYFFIASKTWSATLIDATVRASMVDAWKKHGGPTE